MTRGEPAGPATGPAGSPFRNVPSSSPADEDAERRLDRVPVPAEPATDPPRVADRLVLHEPVARVVAVVGLAPVVVAAGARAVEVVAAKARVPAAVVPVRVPLPGEAVPEARLGPVLQVVVPARVVRLVHDERLVHRD